MSPSVAMGALALVWLGAILVVFRASAQRRRGGVGLTLAFLFAMTFEYVGALAYMVPGYTHLRPQSDLYLYLLGYGFTPATVVRGIALTVLGIVAFTVGAVLVHAGGRPRPRPLCRASTAPPGAFRRSAGSRLARARLGPFRAAPSPSGPSPSDRIRPGPARRPERLRFAPLRLVRTHASRGARGERPRGQAPHGPDPDAHQRAAREPGAQEPGAHGPHAHGPHAHGPGANEPGAPRRSGEWRGDRRPGGTGPGGETAGETRTGGARTSQAGTSGVGTSGGGTSGARRPAEGSSMRGRPASRQAAGSPGAPPHRARPRAGGPAFAPAVVRAEANGASVFSPPSAFAAGPRSAGRAFDPMAMQLVGLLALTGLVLSRVRLPLPMIDALQQVGQNAAVVYVCLGAYMVRVGVREGTLLPWMALAAAIPAFYLLFAGFLSFGFAAFVIVSAFALVALRRGRLSTPLFAGLFLGVLYALLSVFVVYMSFRTELRAAIWGGAGIGERIGAVAHALGHVRLLDPFDAASLDHLVVRLNQGVFVGKVAEYHDAVEGLWLYGQSLVLALVAWIPRVVWPGKPGLGGSDFLAAHTGQSFSSGATFGAGQVVEFYANFGAAGVAGGFFVLGLAVSAIDRRAGRALRHGRLMTAALWFTGGLGLVRPLSSVFFLVNTALATVGVFAAMRLALPSVRRIAVERGARRLSARRLRRTALVLAALRTVPPVSRPAEAADVRRTPPPRPAPARPEAQGEAVRETPARQGPGQGPRPGPGPGPGGRARGKGAREEGARGSGVWGGGGRGGGARGGGERVGPAVSPRSRPRVLLQAAPPQTEMQPGTPPPAVPATRLQGTAQRSSPTRPPRTVSPAVRPGRGDVRAETEPATPEGTALHTPAPQPQHGDAPVKAGMTAPEEAASPAPASQPRSGDVRVAARPAAPERAAPPSPAPQGDRGEARARDGEGDDGCSEPTTARRIPPAPSPRPRQSATAAQDEHPRSRPATASPDHGAPATAPPPLHPPSAERGEPADPPGPSFARRAAPPPQRSRPAGKPERCAGSPAVSGAPRKEATAEYPDDRSRDAQTGSPPPSAEHPAASAPRLSTPPARQARAARIQMAADRPGRGTPIERPARRPCGAGAQAGTSRQPGPAAEPRSASPSRDSPPAALQGGGAEALAVSGSPRHGAAPAGPSDRRPGNAEGRAEHSDRRSRDAEGHAGAAGPPGPSPMRRDASPLLRHRTQAAAHGRGAEAPGAEKGGNRDASGGRARQRGDAGRGSTGVPDTPAARAVAAVPRRRPAAAEDASGAQRAEPQRERAPLATHAAEERGALFEPSGTRVRGTGRRGREAEPRDATAGAAS